MNTSSCNQNGLAVVSGFRNLITSPFDGIRGRVSSRRYDDLRIETKDLDSALAQNTACHQVRTELTLSRSSISTLSDSIRDTACSCVSWGNCSSSECSCNKLCPNDFEIFKRAPIINSTQDLSSPQNSLSFRNEEAMKLSKHRGTQGYCWGHAAITAQFNRLGFFKPEDTVFRKGLEAPVGSKERKDALLHYKRIIDDIAKNRVREISGFSNLEEFSDHPDLQSYLADKVAKSWSRNAISFQGLGSITKGVKRMTPAESSKLVSNIIERLDNNQQPQLLFTKENDSKSSHLALVSHYIKRDNQLILCLRDNSRIPLSNLNCENKILMNKEGRLVYDVKGWGDLGGVRIAHNENSDTLKQFEALRIHCQKSKNCVSQ